MGDTDRWSNGPDISRYLAQAQIEDYSPGITKMEKGSSMRLLFIRTENIVVTPF